MKYTVYELEQIDFTHPYMTVNQMKQMIIRNYEKPRDFFLYSTSPEQMIEDLEKQLADALLDEVDENSLRLPILVFPIPTREMWEPVKYGFIVKYDANGTTSIHYPILDGN